MSRTIKCHGCGSQADLGDDFVGESVTCPYCGATVDVSPKSSVHWRPPPTPTSVNVGPSSVGPSSPGSPGPSSWMPPAGCIAVVLGLLAFCASAARERHFPGGFISGIANPLFFVCVPLGIYWLLRGRTVRQSQQFDAQSSTQGSAGIVPQKTTPGDHTVGDASVFVSDARVADSSTNSSSPTGLIVVLILGLIAALIASLPKS